MAVSLPAMQYGVPHAAMVGGGQSVGPFTGGWNGAPFGAAAASAFGVPNFPVSNSTFNNGPTETNATVNSSMCVRSTSRSPELDRKTDQGCFFFMHNLQKHPNPFVNTNAPVSKSEYEVKSLGEMNYYMREGDGKTEFGSDFSDNNLQNQWLFKGVFINKNEEFQLLFSTQVVTATIAGRALVPDVFLAQTWNGMISGNSPNGAARYIIRRRVNAFDEVKAQNAYNLSQAKREEGSRRRFRPDTTEDNMVAAAAAVLALSPKQEKEREASFYWAHDVYTSVDGLPPPTCLYRNENGNGRAIPVGRVNDNPGGGNFGERGLCRRARMAAEGRDMVLSNKEKVPWPEVFAKLPQVEMMIAM